MHKADLMSIMTENGYELMEELSIINGFKLYFDNGAIISIVNDDKVTLSGESQELVAEMLGLNDGQSGGRGAVAAMLAEEEDEVNDDEFSIDMGPGMSAPTPTPEVKPTPASEVKSTPAPEANPTSAVADAPVAASSEAAITGNKVLLSCGSDEGACTQLEGMLRQWGMEPVVMNRLENAGQTMVEKLANLSGQVCFGIVIASPDDEGYRVGHPDEASHRARQNVVLEMGMLLGKLGRKRVAILLKHQEDMERPSDIQGLNYIPYFDDLEKDAGTLLEKEVRAFGAGGGN